jgi:LPS sulfotransferase NodH
VSSEHAEAEDARHLAEALRALPPEAPPVPLAHQLRAAVHGLLPRATPRPFLIYAQGRTGSTLLGNLLGSHPQVEYADEVLNGRVLRPHLHLQGLRKAYAPATYGVHVKPYHLTRSQGIEDRAGFLRRCADRGWLVVHLRRENVLRHVLSNVTRSATGAWHFHTDDGRASAQVVVDVESVLSYMRSRALLAQQEERDVEGLDVVRVSYERDLLPGEAGWDAVAAEVFGRLGLPAAHVTTSLRRINQGSLADIVANHHELAAAVSAAGWGDLLD